MPPSSAGSRGWPASGSGAALVLCLADWVLIEDLGFLGGLGTDPNSMIPMALLFVSGYLAMTRVPAHQAAAAEPAAGSRRARRRRQVGRSGARAARGQAGRLADRPTPQARGAGSPDLLQSALRSLATASAVSIAAAGALGVVLVGVLPSAAASANPNADPIIAQAIGGTANAVNYPAAGFTPHRSARRAGEPGQPARQGGAAHLPRSGVHIRLPADRARVRGRRAAAGRRSGRVQLAAVVLSPTYRSLAAVQAFDRQEGLSRLPDWLYLTGTLPQLRGMARLRDDRADIPAGAMTLHNDVAYVIDRDGRVRQVHQHRPGPGDGGLAVVVRGRTGRCRPAGCWGAR